MPFYSNKSIQKIGAILKSGKVNYWTGNEGRQFEKEFANWCESNYAVAVANGTLALDLALKALDISAGDEVIVTPRSFIASVSCVVNAGAVPVFVDIDKDNEYGVGGFKHIENDVNIIPKNAIFLMATFLGPFEI